MAKMTYKATHDETGEVIVGSADDLAEALSVTANRIYLVASAGSKVGFHWCIEKTSHTMTDNDNKWPMELSAEWERVTRTFKKASRKAGGQDA